MKRFLIRLAGTLLFFAIATLLVPLLFGRDQILESLMGGGVSIASFLLTRWLVELSLRHLEEGQSWAFLAGFNLRLALVVMSLFVVPALVDMDIQIFAAWLLFYYLVFLVVETIDLARSQS